METLSSSGLPPLATHRQPQQAVDRRICGCTARAHLIAIAILLSAGIGLVTSGAVLSMQLVLIVGSVTAATAIFYATLFFSRSFCGTPTAPSSVKYTYPIEMLQSEEFWWRFKDNEQGLKKFTSSLDRHDVAAIPFEQFPAGLTKEIYQALSSNVDAVALQKQITEKVLTTELLEVMTDHQINMAYGEVIAADILSEEDSLRNKPLCQKYGITWNDLRSQQEKILYAIVNEKTVERLNQLVEKILLYPELIKWRTLRFTTEKFIDFLSQSDFDFIAFFKEIDLSKTCVNFYQFYIINLVDKQDRKAELEAIFSKKSVVHAVLPLLLETLPKTEPYNKLLTEITESFPRDFLSGLHFNGEIAKRWDLVFNS